MKWFKICLLTVLVFILLTGFAAAATDTKIPVSKAGVIDLTGLDFQKSDPLTLDGEWDFYWDRLLTEDMLEREKPDAAVEVPDTWNEYKINGHNLPGVGFATYRLHVKTALPAGTMLGLRVYALSSAYYLYADDKLIASNGTVAKTMAGEVGEYRPQAVFFPAPGKDFDLILQISNHQYARGGFWYSMYFGDAASIQALNDRIMGKESFILGTLVIAALFYFTLFFLSKELRCYLYFALLCLCSAVSLDMLGQYQLLNWIPGISFSNVILIWYSTTNWLFFLVLLYMHGLFPSKFSKIVTTVFFILTSLSQILYFFTPTLFYTRFGRISNDLCLISVVCAAVIIGIGIKKGYRGAWINLLCVILILLVNIHDFLFWMNETKAGMGELMYAGVFIVVLLQMISQAQRAKGYSDREAAAELSFLQAQIKPHFLFNSLNTFIAISRYDPEKARMLMIDFSNYLRRCFDFKNASQFVPLSSEIKLAQAYTAIEKARFEERLEICFIVPEEQNAMVPTLILQPLIENAVVHGILPKTEGGRVEIVIRQEKQNLCFIVSDNGIGMKKNAIAAAADRRSEEGIALYNIDSRLRKLYGQGLKIKSNAGVGTEISWTVPIGRKGREKAWYTYFLSMTKDRH